MFKPKQGQHVRVISLESKIASISALQIHDIDSPKLIADGGVWSPTAHLSVVAILCAFIPEPEELLVWSSWEKGRIP